MYTLQVIHVHTGEFIQIETDVILARYGSNFPRKSFDKVDFYFEKICFSAFMYVLAETNYFAITDFCIVQTKCQPHCSTRFFKAYFVFDGPHYGCRL